MLLISKRKQKWSGNCEEVMSLADELWMPDSLSSQKDEVMHLFLLSPLFFFSASQAFLLGPSSVCSA